MAHFHRRHLAVLTTAALVLLLPGCASEFNYGSPETARADRLGDGSIPLGSFEATMRVGDATRRAGDSGLAAAFYQRAHQMEPVQPQPLVRMGYALNDLGAYAEAEAAFQEALTLGPRNAEALRGLGATYLGRNQPQLALDQFQAALAIEPDDSRSLNGMGVANDQLGDHAAAQQYYQTGLGRSPNSLTLLNNFGLSKILNQDFAGAIEILSQAVQHPGAGARQRQNLALAYGMAGQTDIAEQIARIDLDERMVRNNLAYYATLRAADDRTLTAAVLGLRDERVVHAGQSETKFAQQAPSAPLPTIAGDEAVGEPPADGPAAQPGPQIAPEPQVEPVQPRVRSEAATESGLKEAAEKTPPRAAPSHPVTAAEVPVVTPSPTIMIAAVPVVAAPAPAEMPAAQAKPDRLPTAVPVAGASLSPPQSDPPPAAIPVTEAAPSAPQPDRPAAIPVTGTSPSTSAAAAAPIDLATAEDSAARISITPRLGDWASNIGAGTEAAVAAPQPPVSVAARVPGPVPVAVLEPRSLPAAAPIRLHGGDGGPFIWYAAAQDGSAVFADRGQTPAGPGPSGGASPEAGNDDGVPLLSWLWSKLFESPGGQTVD